MQADGVPELLPVPLSHSLFPPLQVAGPLLDQLYEEEYVRCMDDVSGKLGTLSVDGWTTCSHDPVLAVGLFVNQDSYFLDAIDTNGVSHTAENLLTAVTAAIQKAEETMQVSIVGFVTDSASNMVRCRELLAEKRPQTISVGCQAHWMNLLAKDIVQLAKAVMDKITNILTFFSRNGTHATKTPCMQSFF